jgi:uncharacterized iron-regulated membrane protein
MPTNRFIYFGILIIAASALLWAGAWLAKQVDWLLPYTGLAGLLLIIAGLAIEIKKKKAAALAVPEEAKDDASV